MQKTYNDHRTVSRPSSLGSGPDNALVPKSLECNRNEIRMDNKKYIRCPSSKTSLVYNIFIRIFNVHTAIACESGFQRLKIKGLSSNFVPLSCTVRRHHIR